VDLFDFKVGLSSDNENQYSFILITLLVLESKFKPCLSFVCSKTDTSPQTLMTTFLSYGKSNPKMISTFLSFKKQVLHSWYRVTDRKLRVTKRGCLTTPKL